MRSYRTEIVVAADRYVCLQLPREMPEGAASVIIVATGRDQSDRIGTPDHSVLLCLGPTATVLAVDLCARGVHAVDLGHLGMFWKKRLRGLPMWVTPEDKAKA